MTDSYWTVEGKDIDYPEQQCASLHQTAPGMFDSVTYPDVAHGMIHIDYG